MLSLIEPELEAEETEEGDKGCCDRCARKFKDFNEKYMKPFLIFNYTPEVQEVQDELKEACYEKR